MVIPVYDENPTRRRPYVTWALIAVNVLVFLLSPVVRGARLGGGVPRAGLRRAAAPAAELHAGWLHLLGNMLFLWVFGNNVEDRFGRLAFLLFYLGVGIVSTYAYALVQGNSEDPLVGASGAISGVLGAYLLLFPRARVLGLVSFLFFLPLRLPAWIVLGFYFVLQAVYAYGVGLSGGGSVAYLVHVVGFALGAGVVVVLGRRLRDFPGFGQQRRRLT